MPQGIEKASGWTRQFSCLRELRIQGSGNVLAVFGLHVMACYLSRLGNLLEPGEVLA